MIRNLAWPALVLVVATAGGCRSDGSARDAARLSRQMEELRRRTDGDRHALHELENRVFVLEDRLETAQIERDRTPAVPRLPVVSKRPAPPAPDPSVPPGASPPISTEPPPEPPPAPPPDVDDGRPAIVIRMDGSKEARHARAAPPIDLAAVKEKIPVVPLPPPAATPAAADDPMSVYRRAYQALGRREHAAAIAGLREFLARWPTHDYADNAQYWLGEAYYDQADYRTALAEFRTVVKRYPNGNKVPDALLKVGYCMNKLGENTAAADVLAQLVKIYPRTNAARLAAQRLSELHGRHLR